ncbi:LysE family transporter [Wohlfahrtiimonas chitiniclastica]|uniref:LysE family transporter n=1 Tax=Wohlfahrtiimonas chitiniclastica TaxID=400946 RepID=UPI001BCD755E|nr:LysE family transporter [Wohlfahrtiimonas chitiniclastica]MBS7818910.1 LysE family transporter [Wohlfahrtiimonas chitiniclastica]MBS7826562.1 LysE family transporter [Wohlfahrtiimonas chitiniclastica]
MILLASIAMTQLVALASPGPDFFFISQVAASRPREDALKAIFGVTLGVFVWALLALLGLNIVLKQLPWLHRGIMTLGGGYLLYLAYLLMRAALKPIEMTARNATAVKQRFFLKGLLTNLSNTKALIYFVSVFSAIVTGSVDLSTKAMILGIITLETLVWFLFIARLFSLPKVKQKYQQYAPYIDGLAGICFLLFGGFLVYAGLFSAL